MSSEYIKAYESNVNLPLKNIPIFTKSISDCNYGINFIQNILIIYLIFHLKNDLIFQYHIFDQYKI